MPLPVNKGDDDDDFSPSVMIKSEELPDAGLEFSRDPDEVMEFLGEVAEHLVKADDVLLEIESSTATEEHLASLFRSFHTIKGLAGFFNANLMAKVAHETESLMDEAREGRAQLCGATIDIVFDAVAELRAASDRLKQYIESGSLPPNNFDLAAFQRRIHKALTGEVDTALMSNPSTSTN